MSTHAYCKNIQKIHESIKRSEKLPTILCTDIFCPYNFTLASFIMMHIHTHTCTHLLENTHTNMTLLHFFNLCFT